MHVCINILKLTVTAVYSKHCILFAVDSSPAFLNASNTFFQEMLPLFKYSRIISMQQSPMMWWLFIAIVSTIEPSLSDKRPLKVAHDQFLHCHFTIKDRYGSQFLVHSWKLSLLVHFIHLYKRDITKSHIARTQLTRRVLVCVGANTASDKACASVKRVRTLSMVRL